jgi:hypothetical protein
MRVIFILGGCHEKHHPPPAPFHYLRGVFIIVGRLFIIPRAFSVLSVADRLLGAVRVFYCHFFGGLRGRGGKYFLYSGIIRQSGPNIRVCGAQKNDEHSGVPVLQHLFNAKGGGRLRIPAAYRVVYIKPQAIG